MDDLLLVMAEVGVGLAGFASIATVLAHRQEGRAEAANRLRVMLVLSLAVVFLALLPAILNQFGLGLRVAAAIFAAAALFNLMPFSPLQRGYRATREAGVSWNPFYREFIRGLGLVPLACFLVALGLVPEIAGGIYVGSLASVLLVAAIAFARLVLSLIQPAA